MQLSIALRLKGLSSGLFNDLFSCGNHSHGSDNQADTIYIGMHFL